MKYFLVFPHLCPRDFTSQIILNDISLVPYPHPDREEPDAVLRKQLHAIRIAFNTQSIYYATKEFPDAGFMISFSREMETKCVIPFRYSILSNSARTTRVSYEQTNAYVILPAQDSHAVVHGYRIFLEGTEMQYVRQAYPVYNHGIEQCDLEYDEDVLSILLPLYNDNRLVNSLEWFNKSFKNRVDAHDRIIFLSISIEALLALERSTSRAEGRLRSAVDEQLGNTRAIEERQSISNFINSLIPSIGAGRGILSESLTRNLQEKIFAITGSMQIANYVVDAYEVGCAIRHGDDVPVEDLWYGPNRHLFHPSFLQLLHRLLVLNIHNRELSDHIKRVMVLTLANYILSDKERMEKWSAILERIITGENVGNELSLQGHIQYDRSGSHETSLMAFALLKKGLRVMENKEREVWNTLLPEANLIQEYPDTENSSFTINHTCRILARKLEDNHRYSSLIMVVLDLARYKQWHIDMSVG